MTTGHPGTVPLVAATGSPGDQGSGARDGGTGGPAGSAGTAERFEAARRLTETLADPLSAEDQTVQSMPDVSPTKWHRAHTSWFFETFLLEPHQAGYAPFHPAFRVLFNSYYEGVGPRHARAERGLITRPGIDEVAAYRRHVDGAMSELLAATDDPVVLGLVELGIQHEQQHQELLLMDAKHVLSRNPLLPAYAPLGAPPPGRATAPAWTAHPGGPVEIGHQGPGFAFDNESPRHVAHLVPFALADRPVTSGEWLAFMDDGGYRRPELWLSEGWARAAEEGWEAPLYWSLRPAGWHEFTLAGERPVDPARPVCHVSYFEADAFARWAGARLPTEAEWEAVSTVRAAGQAGAVAPARLLDTGVLAPTAVSGGASHPFGDVWQWTSSSYSPYPGFTPPPGAVGEYNGKFMVNQYVLRGGSCATPPGHVRATYRNFFPAGARWAFSGLRLARDA
jgi:ergothioneine biosynthesis protein EgtB